MENTIQQAAKEAVEPVLEDLKKLGQVIDQRMHEYHLMRELLEDVIADDSRGFAIRAQTYAKIRRVLQETA